MKAKIILALKSRTFWSAVALFVVSGIDGVKDLIPVSAQLPIDAILTAMVGYFRVNTRV